MHNDMETHLDVVLLLCLWACVCLQQDQLAGKAPTKEAQRPSHQDHPHIQWHLKIKYAQNKYYRTGHKDKAAYKIRIRLLLLLLLLYMHILYRFVTLYLN